MNCRPQPADEVDGLAGLSGGSRNFWGKADLKPRRLVALGQQFGAISYAKMCALSELSELRFPLTLVLAGGKGAP